MRISILYQDTDLIVVDKPAGLPTHAVDPRDPYPGDVLRVVQQQTGLPYLGMHQRLDAETSGVLLFSARPQVNKALAAAFQGRATQKVYLAAVWGSPPEPEGVIDAPLVRDRDGRYRVTSADDPRGQPARTRYRVLPHLRSDDLSRPDGVTTEVVTTKARTKTRTESPLRSDDLSRPDGVTTEVVTTKARTKTRAESPLRSDDLSRPGGVTAEVVTTKIRPVCTLLEIIPETGRTHQIRVHLAHIGCPVVGDPLYSPKARGGEPLYPFFPQMCLHAWRLTLPHPATGQLITFTAPLPTWVQHVEKWSQGPGPSPKRGEKPAKSVMPAFRSAVGRADFTPEAVRPLFELALVRRTPLAADPGTTIYRLVNAAADGLPGLAVDRYGDALVVSLYTGEEAPLPLPDALWPELLAMTRARAVYVRYRPRQASRLTEEDLARLAPSAPVAGADLGPAWIAHEEGLAYQIRPGEGLSVGLFPDMREGRGRVRAWAAGRRVLNCFAYTCGFGVAATAGGAARVLNLDLSKSALAWGQENYRANGFAPDPYDFVFGDVFDWLARFARRQERFDMIILDPPGFARAKGRTFAAAQNYPELVALAARVTSPGGLLLACCNVAELPWRAFRERVLAGIAAAGRRSEIIGIHHEPALDFPVTFGQEPYLKMAWLKL